MNNTPPDHPMTSSDAMKKGRLFIISAPSGAGKTTLGKAILKRFPEMLYSISHTTRPPRTDEENGVDYFFISKDEFKKNIKDGKWLEWAKVHDNYYGTSLEFIDRNLSEGRNILLDIDVSGARQVLSHLPHSVAIFILPPSFETLRERLESRGTESPETIAKRLKNAEVEIAQKHLYQHHVINDSLNEAIERLSLIIKSHMFRNGKDTTQTRR
jgi:guanylate kinase